MLKVLHVIDSQGLYGAELVLLNLMQIQIKKGIEPLLLSVGDIKVLEKDVEVEARRRGLMVHSMRFRDGLNLRGSKLILNFAKENKVDVIHSHGYKGDILLGIIPKFIRKVPVVTTIHGWVGIEKYKKFYFYEILDALSIKNLEHTIVVSSKQRSHPNLILLKIKPTVIHNGISLLNFKHGWFKKHWPEIAQKVTKGNSIFSIGRFSSIKGYDLLTKAVSILFAIDNTIQLALCGDGREEDNLRKLTKSMGLSDNVHFLGYQDNAFQFIPSFDVFVIPSYSEGLPITLLEAMQAGVPIVATSVGEIPQVLKHGELGQLVPPGDAEVLSQAILRVFQNPAKFKKMALEAKKHVLEEYSLEKMSQKYSEVYQDVIS